MTKQILIVGADGQLKTLIEDALAADSFDLTFSRGNDPAGLNPSFSATGVLPSHALSVGSDKSQDAGSPKIAQLIICYLDGCAMHWKKLLSHWRQNAETALVPIIVIASAQNLSQARLGMELGADDYILTPFASECLTGAVQARLQRQARLEGMQQQTHLLAQALKNELTALQAQLKDVKRVDELKSNLLKRAAQDLREPLSNINMALHLLKGASSEAERARYIAVLESECVRELSLLDDISNVQSLLTPDNTLLLQKFQMLATS